MPWMSLWSTSTTRFLSISVFLLLNFFTRSLEEMGLLFRYLWISSSVMVLGEYSVLCFLAGGWLLLPDAPGAALLVPALSGEGAAAAWAVCSLDSCSLSLLVPCWELAWLLDFFFDLLWESFFEAACALMSNLPYTFAHCDSMVVSLPNSYVLIIVCTHIIVTRLKIRAS